MTGIRHSFVSTATAAIPKNLLTNVSFLVVGGGGGGGAGGGGAGGYIEGTTNLTNGTYTIIVGAGGVVAGVAYATSGENSMLSGNLITQIAIGGGAGGGGGPGGRFDPTAGRNGGSGGGGPSNGALSYSQYGLATPGQGNDGGSGYYYASGGGGGAGSAGGWGFMYDSGGPGTGKAWINTVTYSTGGGSGGPSATANSGNGGWAANGASGIVIIRYSSTQRSAVATTGSPVFTDSGGIKQYVFNSSGTITF
jgi:hypothetical protein